MHRSITVMLGLAIIGSYSIGIAVSGFIDGDFGVWRIALAAAGIPMLVAAIGLHFPLRQPKLPSYRCASGEVIARNKTCPKCGATIKERCRVYIQNGSPAI